MPWDYSTLAECDALETDFDIDGTMNVDDAVSTLFHASTRAMQPFSPSLDSSGCIAAFRLYTAANLTTIHSSVHPLLSPPLASR